MNYEKSEILAAIAELVKVSEKSEMKERESGLMHVLDRLTHLYVDVINDYPTSEKRFKVYCDMMEKFRHDLETEYLREYFKEDSED